MIIVVYCIICNSLRPCTACTHVYTFTNHLYKPVDCMISPALGGNRLQGAVRAQLPAVGRPSTSQAKCSLKGWVSHAVLPFDGAAAQGKTISARNHLFVAAKHWQKVFLECSRGCGGGFASWQNPKSPTKALQPTGIHPVKWQPKKRCNLT